MLCHWKCHKNYTVLLKGVRKTVKTGSLKQPVHRRSCTSLLPHSLVLCVSMQLRTINFIKTVLGGHK